LPNPEAKWWIALSQFPDGGARKLEGTLFIDFLQQLPACLFRYAGQRCHLITVSGFTIAMAPSTFGVQAGEYQTVQHPERRPFQRLPPQHVKLMTQPGSDRTGGRSRGALGADQL
jgi:hypothetical protein